MITAKEARKLFNAYKDRMDETKNFLQLLSGIIEELSNRGKTSTFIKLPTDRNSISLITNTLTENGYGWKVRNCNDDLILDVWW